MELFQNVQNVGKKKWDTCKFLRELKIIRKIFSRLELFNTEHLLKGWQLLEINLKESKLQIIAQIFFEKYICRELETFWNGTR